MTIASRFVLKALERLSVGRMTLHLPDGTIRRLRQRRAPEPEAELDVRDWRFFRRVLLDGDIGFAEAYMEGLCDSPDLPALIALLAENEKALGRMAHTNPLHGLLLKLLHRRRDNSREGLAQQHRRPLRPRQRLLPAVARPDDDLLVRRSSSGARRAARGRADRQVRAHLRRSSALGPGDHVLEIGCGWGGFAVYARARARLPRHRRDDLARAARLRARARRTSRARRPRRPAAARLPRHRRALRPASSRSR